MRKAATKKTSSGFPISVDGVELAKPSVFKVFFGRKYFIWKGKNLGQSIDFIGKSINARMRDGNLDKTNFMYHVANHVLKSKVMCGICKIEFVFNDYESELGIIDGYSMLKKEQEMLNESINDPYCLNNNVQAYVPDNNAYITNKDKQRFLNWYEKNISKWK